MAARKPTRAKAKTGVKAKRGAKQTQPQNLFINSAHQVWLAGLGALARAQKEGPKLFETLVAEGQTVHNRTRDAAQEALMNAMQGVRGAMDERVEGLRDRVDDMRDRANETWDNIEKIFQSRVHKALRQLGVPTASDINALSRKVNDLTKSVEALARKRTAATAAEIRSVSLEQTKPGQANA